MSMLGIEGGTPRATGEPRGTTGRRTLEDGPNVGAPLCSWLSATIC